MELGWPRRTRLRQPHKTGTLEGFGRIVGGILGRGPLVARATPATEEIPNGFSGFDYEDNVKNAIVSSVEV